MAERTEGLSISIGLLLLRVGVGAYLAGHGFGKLQMLIDGEFEKFGDPLGIGKAPSLVLITLAEFFGSIAVVLGLATRFAAASIVIGMGVAAFVVHGGDPWTMGTAAQRFLAGESKTFSSKEPALLYLIPNLALVFTGAGRIALDALLGRWWRSRA